MEYCPSDLERVMKQQKLFSKEELLKYSKEVVQSVCACHSKNIAHCDIKPANFLVDKYGRLKIGDFGLSSVYDDQYTCDLFKGTIIYMAPEVFESEDYNPIIVSIQVLGMVALRSTLPNTCEFDTLQNR
ncbi:hypothetical protein TVAG_041470 [Trichomonas vaginalis G3]|uniref:Protein kinase domain-containing protein n=1 Tax=Trichomonas vaginalis (strain ATCC PRA-98 / G3) TaxID=412133 RepID=A2GGI0_TRIV3|nr:hypothetical protein TVAG_041470 [Trichomonas vaginalis G3]|eukprot:XP_001296667.1 hypothetical protein [Trichomonas vaginalis G3]